MTFAVHQFQAFSWKIAGAKSSCCDKPEVTLNKELSLEDADQIYLF
jgi:hypothetical protein